MTSPDGQIAMSFSETGGRQRRSRWLGLATDHRRLFGALADGWLRPLQSRAGVLIGVGAYAAEPSDAPGDHPVAVRIRLDAAKLPALAVSVRRGEGWVASRLEEFEATDAALYWPGALPAFAFSEISVSTEEERRRLEGLARNVSNVDLVATALRVDADAEGTIEPDALPEVSSAFVIPEDEDAIHGAMSMAVWAVPRIDPWLDVLTASLASDRARLPEIAAGVEAGMVEIPALEAAVGRSGAGRCRRVPLAGGRGRFSGSVGRARHRTARVCGANRDGSTALRRTLGRVGSDVRLVA